jgi:hypothetical protein
VGARVFPDKDIGTNTLSKALHGFDSRILTIISNRPNLFSRSAGIEARRRGTIHMGRSV